ncbi:MAG: SsrA-binding protein SmpB [Bacilli bacterium]|nr:SsrA-binding protein SmpB [Bacilli bacterium]
MGTKNRIVCHNKRAHFDYFIEDTYECGIVLTGTEIKSIRLGKVSIDESFCYIKQGEVYIDNMHISKYEQGNIFNHDPVRKRKLLLNKREILKISSNITKDGYTLIPLDVHFSNGFAKVNIGIAKGKKLYDKRESIKERDIKRNIDKNYY